MSSTGNVFASPHQSQNTTSMPALAMHLQPLTQAQAQAQRFARPVPPSRRCATRSPCDSVVSPVTRALRGRTFFAAKRCPAGLRGTRMVMRNAVPQSPCDDIVSPVSRALKGRTFFAAAFGGPNRGPNGL